MPSPTLTYRALDQTTEIYILRANATLPANVLRTHVSGGRVLIITHPSLKKLFAAQINAWCARAQLHAHWLTLPTGERTKSLATMEKIYAACTQHRLTRHDAILSLGGGVIHDLCGFAAATWQRGMRWIACPTTLVAQLDSSIGGKVGVNTAAGKNLIGAIYQPNAIVAHAQWLESLPPQAWHDGLTEALKCGLIADPRLFTLCARVKFSKNFSPSPNMRTKKIPIAARTLAEIIRRSIVVKIKLITQDPRDLTGKRALLNLGHTTGHALERYGKFSHYTHGQAVALGLIASAKISAHHKLCAINTAKKICDVVTATLQPPPWPPLPAQVWENLLTAEKKRTRDQINFITLRDVGKLSITPITPHALALQLSQLIE